MIIMLMHLASLLAYYLGLSTHLHTAKLQLQNGNVKMTSWFPHKLTAQLEKNAEK